MSLLPMGNNYNPLTQGLNLGKILGGAIGAYYGSKNGGFMDGLLGGYAGYNKPSSLYDRIMDQYLPNQSKVILKKDEGVL
jgi:hypothetical protein